MKKFFVPAAFGVLLACQAQAATVQVSWAANHSGSGGEFIMNTSANGLFNSFCIEHNEFINPNGSTYTYTISSGAVAGGYTGAVNGTDLISIGTAYLYRSFIDQTLGGYSSSSSANQNNLQNAIWWLEGELGVAQNDVNYAFGTNPYLQAAKTALGKATFADLKADANGAYGVFAMNLSNLDGSRAQDQLIVVPDGGMTLGMLGMACGGLGWLRRKS